MNSTSQSRSSLPWWAMHTPLRTAVGTYSGAGRTRFPNGGCSTRRAHPNKGGRNITVPHLGAQIPITRDGNVYRVTLSAVFPSLVRRCPGNNDGLCQPGPSRPVVRPVDTFRISCEHIGHRRTAWQLIRVGRGSSWPTLRHQTGLIPQTQTTQPPPRLRPSGGAHCKTENGRPLRNTPPLSHLLCSASTSRPCSGQSI